MKDAKGHGSNPRGTVAGYAGRDQLGRTYTQAIRDHDRFPAQNPSFPNAEDYATQHGIPTHHLKVIPTRPAGDTNPFRTRTATIPFGRRK